MAIHSARFLESGELFVARIRCLALRPRPTSRARDFWLAFPFVTAFAQLPERPFPWPQAFDTILIAGRPGAQFDQLSPAGLIRLSVTIPLRDSPEWTLFGVRLEGRRLLGKRRAREDNPCRRLRGSTESSSECLPSRERHITGRTFTRTTRIKWEFMPSTASSASAANCSKPKSGSWRRGLNCTGPNSWRTGADCKPAGGRSGSRRSAGEDTSHGTSGLPGNRL